MCVLIISEMKNSNDTGMGGKKEELGLFYYKVLALPKKLCCRGILHNKNVEGVLLSGK